MVKVAIVCGAGIVSGKEVMALELGQGLRESGVEVYFITSRWGSGEFGRRTEAAGFPTYRLWLGFISATLRFDCIWMTLDQLWHWPALFIRYRRFLKNVNPVKVIHTNWHHVLLLWPLLRPERDMYWVHEVIPNKRQYLRLFQGFADRIGCFVAVSNTAAKSLTEIGVPVDKVRVIYNGITDPSCGYLQTNENHAPTIGIVGQVGQWKGHEDLLAAFQTVLRSYPATQLNVFGTGSAGYETFLRHRAAELGVGGNVIWRGFIADVARVYRDTQILVIPSRCEESFGLTAVEAGFFRIPVIASRRGALSEVVEDGVTGYLFDPENVDQLVENLLNLISNVELRREMGRKARNRAKSLFSRERFVRDFTALLEVKGTKAKQNGHSIDNAS